MNDFNYSYPTKVYFGTGAEKKPLQQSLENSGKPLCWHTAVSYTHLTLPTPTSV